MKKLITSFILLTICMNYAYACSCVMSKPNFMLFSSSEVIFAGKIIAIKHDTANTDKVTFEIYKRFKGVGNNINITISTNAWSGMCGINGNLGEKFLIFANQHGDNNLWTDICMHSGLIKNTHAEFSMLNSIRRKGNKWYESGSLKAIGEMKDDKEEGQWQFFEKGKMVMEGSYQHGKQQGKWTTYGVKKDGSPIVSHTNFIKGKFIDQKP